MIIGIEWGTVPPTITFFDEKANKIIFGDDMNEQFINEKQVE